MSNPDPGKVILEAWKRAPAEWPGMSGGVPCKVAPHENNRPLSFFPVEFVREQGMFKGRPVWRVIGTWRGESVHVAYGEMAA